MCCGYLLLHHLERLESFPENSGALERVAVLVVQRHLAGLVLGVLAVLPLLKLGA